MRLQETIRPGRRRARRTTLVAVWVAIFATVIVLLFMSLFG